MVADAINYAHGQNYTGPVVARLHFCSVHRAYRAGFTRGAFLALLFGIALLIWARIYHAGKNDPFIFIPGFVILISGLVFIGLLIGRFDIWSFKAVRFEDQIVSVKGAGAAFVLSLRQIGEPPAVGPELQQQPLELTGPSGGTPIV